MQEPNINNFDNIESNNIIDDKKLIYDNIQKLTKTTKALKMAAKLKQQKNKDQSQTKNIDFNINNFDEFATHEFVKINIYITQRNSRKSITTIRDIPRSKFIDDDKVRTFMNKLKNIIASRATLKNKNTEPEIEISGSDIQRIIPLICDFCSCTNDDIVIHGGY